MWTGKFKGLVFGEQNLRIFRHNIENNIKHDGETYERYEIL